ncbi:presequence translocated-associated motor subunit [Heterostelium album PN500]|uniref:Presequence translocated-associated motor subunit n=1 Tax=Heterostelium pallidum (strain ATCC 26659 / Pp 5 / PN500) TaxID=670386 RepID=D3BJF4_HETP5|nr:presequence translocated-associated motor subunit [Heterostelium album PN500]EFA78034.1 presequence translocated-associated motor subunit [Heterostelium album PN500]|eukprot:XP_020430162.1 presequence translocated-associated motor subunit [Heterostelium album PN500]
MIDLDVLKIFANLLITTGTVFVRSLSLAYKQAIARAESTGAKTASDFAKSESFSGTMTPIEAKKILGLDNRHAVLLDLNNPEDGGSKFIQNKVIGAKSCLEEAIKSGKEI